jgi:hypothetical protein
MSYVERTIPHVIDSAGNAQAASSQYPLPTDGDSVYDKDIDVSNSVSTNWSGTVTDVFNDLHSDIENTTSDNPKELLIHFNRTVVSNVIGLGSTAGGDFSNVKIIIINSGDIETTVIDESASSTKYTTRTFQLPITAGFNAVKIQFHTADTVSLTNCVILKSRSVIARLQAAKPDNTVTDINATAGGNLKVSLEEYDNAFKTDPLPVTNNPSTDMVSAFGIALAAEETPIAQLTAHYGLGNKVETFNATGGTVGTSGNEFECTTGTSVGGYGVIRSKRGAIYKGGEGVSGKFTARFTTGVANSLQAAGLFSLTDGLLFGYDGADFSVIHQRNGKAEVRELTISAGASGTESLTIVVNGSSHTFNVTSGSAAFNAAEITAELEANISGWYFTQNGSKVVAMAQSTGAKSGTYSFTNNTGGGTCAGSWAQVTAGVDKTETAVAQADWNVNTFDSLDPTKGNVFLVKYQYLGYGQVSFYIEDPSDGRFTLVHRIEYANANTAPSLGNPTMKIGWISASLGSTTDLSVYGASAGLFIEGKNKPTEPTRAEFNTINVGTTLTNAITLRNRRVFNGIPNANEIKLLELSAQTDSSKGAIIEVIADGTPASEQNFFYVDETGSIAEEDETAISITNGRILNVITLGGAESRTVDLSAFEEVLLPGETISVIARVTSGAASDITIGLTWREDI